MFETLAGLEPMLKSFWYIAVPVSIVFLLQTILSFTGADASDGVEPDFNGDLGEADAPFQLFSFRNLVNFLLGFSWTGIAFYPLVSNKIMLFLLALIVGLAFVAVFFLIIKQIRKLGEDNSFRISETLHKTAEVYLKIPGEKSGKGKVQISVRGSVHELDAVTSGAEIPTGAVVKIVSIDTSGLLIVERM
ncbi:MAG: hypothetical protein ACK57D_11735 [Sphingobacteriales bacterium]|jgi:hypothetical protein